MAESGMLRTGASVLARNPEFGQEGGGKGGGVGVGGKHRVLGLEARGTPFLCICHLLATQCGKVDKPILQMRKLRPKEGKGLAQGHIAGENADTFMPCVLLQSGAERWGWQPLAMSKPAR